jgi:hypothetical protein
VFNCVQLIYGIDHSLYMSNKTNYDRTVKTALSTVMAGLNTENILNFVTKRRLPTPTFNESISAWYTVSVNNPDLSFNGLSTQLIAAVQWKAFNFELTRFATQFNATGLVPATSTEVFVNEVVEEEESPSRKEDFWWFLTTTNLLSKLPTLRSFMYFF